MFTPEDLEQRRHRRVGWMLDGFRVAERDQVTVQRGMDPINPTRGTAGLPQKVGTTTRSVTTVWAKAPFEV